MTLLKLSISVANVGQRIDSGDRDLEAAGGQQPGELREHVCSRAFVVTFRFHTVLSRRGEVDDCVDSIRSYSQLDCPLDVPATKRVNEGIDFPAGYSADPTPNPITIGKRNYAVIGEPFVIRFACQANDPGARIPCQLHSDRAYATRGT
jgi:hypothetical protein